MISKANHKHMSGIQTLEQVSDFVAMIAIIASTDGRTESYCGCLKFWQLKQENCMGNKSA